MCFPPPHQNSEGLAEVGGISKQFSGKFIRRLTSTFAAIIDDILLQPAEGSRDEGAVIPPLIIALSRKYDILVPGRGDK